MNQSLVETKFTNEIVLPQYREEFDRIIDFMNSGASTDGFIMQMKIADLDRKRNQDFEQVSPEMAALIQYKKNG